LELEYHFFKIRIIYGKSCLKEIVVGLFKKNRHKTFSLFTSPLNILSHIMYYVSNHPKTVRIRGKNGKEGSSGGFSGGVNAYFYFQKMDYIRCIF